MLNNSRRYYFSLFAVSLLFISCSATRVSADPVVQKVSGNISHGQTITIDGTGFLSKTTAAPFKWDNFESGTLNQKLSTQGYLEYDGTGAGNWPTYSSTKSYGVGTKSVFHQLGAGVEDFRTNGLSGLNSLEMYYSVMFYWEKTPNSTYSQNPVIKLMRVNSSPSFYNQTTSRPSLYITMRTDLTSTGLDIGYTYNNTMAVDSAEGHFSGPSQGTWHRGEVYIKLSNPAGASNGVVQSWLDGKLEYSRTGITRATDLNGKLMDNFLLPAMVSEIGSLSLNFYIDDLYVDNTISRVEIGNADTYSACTHKEVQLPTSWNSNGQNITIVFNQGAFAVGDQVFLYVIASDGTVNASGLRLTIGQAASSSPGSPPLSTPSYHL